jgi:hypothetical protein
MSDNLTNRVMAVLNAEKDVSLIDKVSALGDCLAHFLVLRFSEDPAFMRDAVEGLKQRLLEHIVESEGIDSDYLN